MSSQSHNSHFISPFVDASKSSNSNSTTTTYAKDEFLPNNNIDLNSLGLAYAQQASMYLNNPNYMNLATNQTGPNPWLDAQLNSFDSRSSNAQMMNMMMMAMANSMNPCVQSNNKSSLDQINPTPHAITYQNNVLTNKIGDNNKVDLINRIDPSLANFDWTNPALLSTLMSKFIKWIGWFMSLL